MLKFKKSTERTSTLKTVGTVGEFVGLGGYHELASAKNFKNAEKRVSIKLVNKENDYEYVNCSTPVSAWLRESTSPEELTERLATIASYPILELPQTDRETGEAIMVLDEATGEEVPLVLYSISFTGVTDMSSTRTTITAAMLAKEVASRAINFADLISI